jgi:NitT/TauT family transport system ATP-binding protein
MARAFAYPSPLILLDEPFQSLDLPLRLQLMDLFRNLLELEGRAGIMVTHDPGKPYTSPTGWRSSPESL